MSVRRMCAAGNHRDSSYAPTGKDHRIGTSGPEFFHDLFDSHYRAAGGEDRLFLHSYDAFKENVAFAVGPLSMDDGDIRAVGRNASQFFSRERAAHEFDIG